MGDTEAACDGVGWGWAEGKIERRRKRKRYCNGTPRGGRVSGSDIIVVCWSDASSSPPNAKYLLA